jgi:hypothetical protein
VRTAVTNITLSDSTFNGKVDTQNYSFILTSNPAPFVTGKVYYRYYDRQNKSDQITTIDGGFAGGAPFVNQLFDYTKNKFGVDLEWALPADFQLGTSYSWLKTNRARGDLPETIDNTYSADLKWTGLDFITPKVGYEHLQRTADVGLLVKEYGTATTGDQGTENDIGRFIRRFDGAPLNRDTFKASVEIYPLANLSLGIGYKYKHSDYKESILGLKSSKSDELNLDAGYTIAKIAQINAYFDMELSKDDQVQRNYQAGNGDPSGVQNANNYNWDVKTKNNSYAWGASTDVYLIPKKLTLTLQYDNFNSSGYLDFTYLTAIPAGRSNSDDNGNWDDYRLSSYIAKIRYTPTKHYVFTAGYAYEHYKYSDASYDNYQFVQGATNYLTGAYANPNYQAHVIFATVAYRF